MDARILRVGALDRLGPDLRPADVRGGERRLDDKSDLICPILVLDPSASRLRRRPAAIHMYIYIYIYIDRERYISFLFIDVIRYAMKSYHIARRHAYVSVKHPYA